MRLRRSEGPVDESRAECGRRREHHAGIVCARTVRGPEDGRQPCPWKWVDDNGNGVVDEPAPAESEAASLYATATSTTPSSGAVSYTPAGSTLASTLNADGSVKTTTTVTDALAARQLYARYLYVLAMLLVDRPGLKASQQMQALYGASPSDANLAEFLAQWAVNVVDFYDRDSIMTPFLYNPIPFTAAGWDEANYPVGPPTGTANVVWGCERPELLITETLAFHDRRTQDLPNDDANKPNHVVGDATNPDPNFDQQYKPQGSLFVELYNPWSDYEPVPGELSKTYNGNTGVDLAKATPAAGVGGVSSPVWRMAIMQRSDAIADPDASSGTLPTPVCAVYFTSASTVTLPTDVPAGKIFRPDTTFTGLIAPNPSRPLCRDRPRTINRRYLEDDIHGSYGQREPRIHYHPVERTSYCIDALCRPDYDGPGCRV